MGVTLITWSCGHFVQQKTPTYRTEEEFLEAVTEDYWILCRSADHDLANVATEHHLASPDFCPQCKQEVPNAHFWHQRATNDIAILRNLHEGCRACYVETGANYHHLDFSQKTRFAYNYKCATAHDQFWISRVPRRLDPFFAPVTNISHLCDEAQHILNTSDPDSQEDVRAAFDPINKARAELGAIITSLNDVVFAVQLMSEAPDKGKGDSGWHSGMLSRESMICIPKAMAWLERMDDWQEDAVIAFRKLLPKT
jgi:hypothetical protein